MLKRIRNMKSDWYLVFLMTCAGFAWGGILADWNYDVYAIITLILTIPVAYLGIRRPWRKSIEQKQNS